MTKIKPHQYYRDKESGHVIEIISKKSGNGHWNTRKTNGSKNSHTIHEGTLAKFYKPVRKDTE